MSMRFELNQKQEFTICEKISTNSCVHLHWDVERSKLLLLRSYLNVGFRSSDCLKLRSTLEGIAVVFTQPTDIVRATQTEGKVLSTLPTNANTNKHVLSRQHAGSALVGIGAQKRQVGSCVRRNTPFGSATYPDFRWIIREGAPDWTLRLDGSRKVGHATRVP